MRSLNKKQSLSKHEDQEPLVYSVGGGKGGVGKSFLTTNLAMLFAKNHSKTLIIDLDFGGANTHTYLEMKRLKHSVFDFLSGKVDRVSEVIQQTKYQDLFIITAHGDWFKEEDNLYDRVPELLKEVKRLNFDRIFLDLGAGTHTETLSGFLEADFQITLVTPEPTSVENTYFFLKKAFYTQLKRVSKKFNFSEQINTILKNKEKFKITKPSLLLKHIENEYGNTGEKITREFSHMVPLFVINQCRTPHDYNLGDSLSQISRNYFGLNAVALGHLSYDNKVWQSVRSLKPLSIEYPNCSVLTEIEQVYKTLKTIEKNHNRTYSLAS
jgi:flagellar biosynthesis protein FlhG